MNKLRTRGATLLEMLIVSSISAIIVGGAVAQFRTIREVSDLTQSRHEALQKARVTLDRIAKTIRAAEEVVEILDDTVADDKLVVSDVDDINYVFYKQDTSSDIEYGIDTPTDILATDTSVTFQGYDAAGQVPRDEPERMSAVHVTVTSTIPGTEDTLTVSTRVHLRNKASWSVIQTQSYAPVHEVVRDGGFVDFDLGYGEPDGQFAYLNNNAKGKYSGFATGGNTGTVARMVAGMYIRYRSGEMNVTVYHGGNTVYDQEWKDERLDSVLNTWGWLWIDVTDAQPSWSDADIDQMEIQIEDSKNLDCDFDSFAVLALFDEAITTYFWADRQGDGRYPSDWQNADLALGATDGTYAVGQWTTQQKQSYRVTVPADDHRIIGAHVVFQGYVVPTYEDDEIEVRCALPQSAQNEGVKVLVTEATLTDYEGAANEGMFFADMSAAYAWTWDMLNDYEIRLRLKTLAGGSHTTFMADAVGWKIIHVQPPSKFITGWGEQ